LEPIILDACLITFTVKFLIVISVHCAIDESIRTQRQIRGEHEAIGSGPTADCFECGDFFAKDSLRTQMSVLVEDSRELIISSSSFVQDDWTCISCDKAHPLLPLKTEKNN
jgi:hypothetical protein